ncbi:hypothetical protein [Mesorhizobium sp. WSM1293]|uniref:hypothetical protein n=1 Tax=Mesorhizobium sp. WSM1293 TaxID=1040984 RepID=UPI0004883230|nr:hypothetical protein [Mesorhizobium sp. WSM1293]
MLYVVTGVRGAGKTTLIDAIRQSDLGLVLQPSTTRAPRFEGEVEYEFVKSWSPERYAWSIKVGEHYYGMRLSEIAKSETAPAFTVFEPIAIQTFYDYRDRSGISAMTIGLDTVLDLVEQNARVGANASRLMTGEQFAAALFKVRAADVVISGDQQAVLNAVSRIVRGC